MADTQSKNNFYVFTNQSEAPKIQFNLTDEEKIVIGVCVGVGGIVLIAIVIIVCYICLNKDRYRKRRRHYVKERIVDDYRPPPYDPIPLPYPPPKPMPLPPPPPPVPVMKIPPAPMVQIPYTDPYIETDYRPTKWDGVFRQEPIVIPLAEPEYVTDGRYIQDPDTIYLKYNDDQALLRSQNYQRRTDYEVAPIRRARSLTGVRTYTVTKRETPYVGEWYRRPDNLNDFNEDAMRQGRDPFLWKSRRY